MLIYCATNKINGKRYVGLTKTSLKERMSGHKRSAKSRPNIKFYRAINKYGFENFEFVILENDITDEGVLKTREVYWIRRMDTYHNGYNSTFGGEDSPMWHKEIRDKVRDANKGRVFSEEHRKNLSLAMKGRDGTPHTEEHKKHMSEVMSGKKKSTEHIEKMRAANIGKKQSKATVEKRMKHVRGVKKSPEHAAKLRENLKKNGFVASGKDHPTSKPVKQIDLMTGEILATFDSMSDANEGVGRSRRSGLICLCLKGERKTAYGYKWEAI